MKLVKCSKCGHKSADAYCPKDGTKLQVDVFGESRNYLIDNKKRAESTVATIKKSWEENEAENKTERSVKTVATKEENIAWYSVMIDELEAKQLSYYKLEKWAKKNGYKEAEEGGEEETEAKSA